MIRIEFNKINYKSIFLDTFKLNFIKYYKIFLIITKKAFILKNLWASRASWCTADARMRWRNRLVRWQTPRPCRAPLKDSAKCRTIDHQVLSSQLCKHFRPIRPHELQTRRSGSLQLLNWEIFKFFNQILVRRPLLFTCFLVFGWKERASERKCFAVLFHVNCKCWFRFHLLKKKFKTQKLKIN